MESAQNIGIIGIGAIGSTISCVLNTAKNHNFYYFNRSEKSEIKVSFPDKEILIQAEINPFPKESITLDWLVICLKVNQYKNAEALLQELIGPKTKVVLIRNGINLIDSISHICLSENMLSCIIDCPVQTKNDGSYQALKYPKLILPKNQLATTFRSVFYSSLSIEIVDDYNIRTWEKLIESASLGLIMVHINGTCKDIIHKKLVHLYESLIVESIKVARADGIDIDTQLIDRLIQKLYNYPPEKGSSMLRDFRDNKTIEWMAKSGIIMDLGSKYDIDLPVHKKLSKTIIQDL